MIPENGPIVSSPVFFPPEVVNLLRGSLCYNCVSKQELGKCSCDEWTLGLDWLVVFVLMIRRIYYLFSFEITRSSYLYRCTGFPWIYVNPFDCEKNIWTSACTMEQFLRFSATSPRIKTTFNTSNFSFWFTVLTKFCLYPIYMTTLTSKNILSVH